MRIMNDKVVAYRRYYSSILMEGQEIYEKTVASIPVEIRSKNIQKIILDYYRHTTLFSNKFQKWLCSVV
jgi:hypothetical protein